MNKTPHIMYVEGVKGEVREPGFQDWIYVESVSKGISNRAVKKGSALASSTAEFDPFRVTKALDKSSPQLFMTAVTGRQIPEIKVVFRRVGKMDPKTGGSTLEPYMEWVFKDCHIESITMSGASLGDPSETMRIYYAEQRESFFTLQDGKKKDTAVGSWSMRTRTGSVA